MSEINSGMDDLDSLFLSLENELIDPTTNINKPGNSSSHRLSHRRALSYGGLPNDLSVVHPYNHYRTPSTSSSTTVCSQNTKLPLKFEYEPQESFNTRGLNIFQPKDFDFGLPTNCENQDLLNQLALDIDLSDDDTGELAVCRWGNCQLQFKRADLLVSHISDDHIGVYYFVTLVWKSSLCLWMGRMY
jgi:hypothetical protein